MIKYKFMWYIDDMLVLPKMGVNDTEDDGDDNMEADMNMMMMQNNKMISILPEDRFIENKLLNKVNS